MTGVTEVPQWVQVCSLLAGTSGLVHDLGKFGKTFQAKLKAAFPVADLVRHEWISLYVVSDMLAGLSWDEAWKKNAETPQSRRWQEMSPFDREPTGAEHASLYMVATHHRLPMIQNGTISNRYHVRDPNKSVRPAEFGGPDDVAIPVAAPSTKNMERIHAMLSEISAQPKHDALYWRAASTYARMALILADHAVSTQVVDEAPAIAYANTNRPTRKLNQPLDWHLEHVCDRAQLVMKSMLSLTAPALPAAVVDLLCTPTSSDSHFYWQETAYQALAQSRAASNLPYLVLNMAGTGSGKTRMNVRAACAIGDRHGEGIRFATALNLRTLTLQTGDAYSEQLQIPANQMSCIIGDTLTLALHDYQKSLQKSPDDDRRGTTNAFAEGRAVEDQIIDDDENMPEEDFDTTDSFEYTSAPDWLKHFLHEKPKLASVIGAPVLVSTIDFLIAAGEPNRQGNHALASLRLMTSDLILDEIDGYDPKALIAVMRLITTSALFGRNVIASSATLSPNVASLVWKAYKAGVQMRSALTACPNMFNTAMIDDAVVPQIAAHADESSFMRVYGLHSQAMLETLKGKRYRIPYLQKIPRKTPESWRAAILDATGTLHGKHRIRVPQSVAGAGVAHHVSFGLVRLANIGPAIRVAQYLASKLPNARVVCYHAQHFPMQRFYIEHRLDTLLRRGEGDSHFWRDADVTTAIADNQAAGRGETLFIVVASPVEEIGRDHDFDWAVIEPSSTQSIVQTAGRVNRHRRVPVTEPNIALLQFNFKAIQGKDYVFEKPGLERGKSHPDHDLATLLDWNGGIEQIDARLRLDHRHRFAKYDDDALKGQTCKKFEQYSGKCSAGLHWMGNETYTEFPLRESGRSRIELMLDPEDQASYQVKEQYSKEPATTRYLQSIIPPVTNAWLIKTDAELEHLALEAGMERDRAMTVSANGPFMNAQYVPSIARDMSFGFYSIATSDEFYK